MFIAETTMTAPVDFGSRFVGNFTQNIVALKSSPYISTIDRNINAKSILGLLSADIRKGDTIRIQTISNTSYEQAESDLKMVKSEILLALDSGMNGFRSNYYRLSEKQN